MRSFLSAKPRSLNEMAGEMIVVDTHAVIWMTSEQRLLSPTARAALAKGRLEGTLAVADITLREIAFQVVRGRVTVGSTLEAYLEFVESLFQVIPITGKIAERSARFGSAFPRDPADRLIGATALVHGAKLVTKDEPIRDSGEVPVIW
jgi:PIN domain nuclease of toxin-antitoxin system